MFRGGEEETIRKTLIERNHIEAIIGLLANIFFGTGIPTIIMVLKRTRSDSDILIIDASKKFEKVGKNNKLRARDIREIVDTLKARKSVTKFAKLVTKDDIRKNEYNLNIPRYVDSSDDEEPWDIHSIMFGGIPNMEIESLRKYWDAFPGLREEIFGNISDNYAIIDECHRSTFGDMLVDIKNTFKNALIFGFTGTPIQDLNAKKDSTTPTIFGDEIHRYTLGDGIRDKNVLGFDPYMVRIYDDSDLREQVALAFVGEGSGRF